MQDHNTKFMMGSVALCAFLGMTQLNSAGTLVKLIQHLLSSTVQNVGAAIPPFACMSNSLNKPIPLNLKVSLPSLHDIQWNFSRLLYLFNIQLERNIAT